MTVFKSYLEDTKGNVAMMFAISLLALITCLGAVVDYARTESSNSKLQSLSDSLTLAAAIGLQNREYDEAGLDEFAEIFLKQHQVSDVQATWEIKGGELSFTLNTVQKMTFTGVFGENEKAIAAVASVPIVEAKDVTLALVLDSTLSMQGTRITSLRRAAHEMIDIIEKSDSNDTYVSVVPFTKMVKIPVTFENATWFNRPDDKTQNQSVIDENLSTNCRVEFTSAEYRETVCDSYVYTQELVTLEWNGCMVSRKFGFHKNPDFMSQRLEGVTRNNYCSDDRNIMTPMTNDLDVISAAVDNMVPHGQTYIPGGLIWGWRTLRPQTPLTEVSQASGNSKRVMIVMTDGANSNSLNGPVPWSNGLLHEENNRAEADTLTAELCESIKNDDVEIYTIALEVTDAATVTLMENCATSRSHFYDVGNSSGLIKVFEDISTEISDIRLSK